MRQEFLDRLQKLLAEKSLNGWKDGWVYGRLNEEFDSLQSDELESMVHKLGFKRGWNPDLKEILQSQWLEDEPVWMQQEEKRLEKELAQIQREQIQKEVSEKKAMETAFISAELEQLRNTLISSQEENTITPLALEASSDLLSNAISELKQLKNDLQDVCQWSSSQGNEAHRRFLSASNIEAKAYYKAQAMAYERIAEVLEHRTGKVKTKIKDTAVRLEAFLDLLQK